MNTDNQGDLFHRLGFCCGCSGLKCYLGNSGVVFIAHRNIISCIYNTAAQAVCKQTHRECNTPTVVYTNLKGEEQKAAKEGEKNVHAQTGIPFHILPERITDPPP